MNTNVIYFISKSQKLNRHFKLTFSQIFEIGTIDTRKRI